MEQTITQLALRHLDASMNAPDPGAGHGTAALRYCRFSCRRCGATGSEEPQGGAPAPRHPGRRLEQLGLKTSAQGLISVVNFQAVTLLAAVDQILQDERLYEEKTVPLPGGPEPRRSWPRMRCAARPWRNISSSSANASRPSGSSTPHLAAWLTPRAAQLDRTTTRLLTKWNGILTQLDAYDTKKPGNSVAILERFVLQDTADLAMANCLPT